MEHLRFFLLFIFQIYLYCFIMGTAESLSASTDRAALLSFKAAVSDPQSFLSGWSHQNISHCTWYGVTCSVKGARVRSLRLSGLGLSAPIPPHLSNLSSLFMLDLANNSFYGHIPPELGRLSHLQYLFLEMNYINGTIPVLISECHNLHTISLYKNQLTGNVPSQLGYLQRLEILDLAINNITGPIPATFGNLTSLKNLSLARNQLLGEIPSELGLLRNIRWIQLSENQLSGEIPYSIWNISSLVYLSLTQNNLTGKLPSNMGSALPNLRQLHLARNGLEGKLPSSLSNASSIQYLELSTNGFHGPIPLFGGMKDLLYLNLGNNLLSSTTELNFQLIDSLKNSTQLEMLMIFSNRLAGQLPSSVANLSTHLQQFCIADNLLTGSFPQGIDRFQELISLSIELNSFVGYIPETIGRLKKLENFAAYRNMFSGEIPDIFANFTHLSSLAIGGNQFSGKIPTSIRACQRLNNLNLAANMLNGSIPMEIFGLSTLSWLNLRQNALSGPLPAEVGNLKQIQFMDVSDNQLSGNISSTIGSCSSLQSLLMAGNNFSGSIPSTIGKLASLESLDLSSNSLTGTIPEELGQLEYLVQLNLSFNHLEGAIPTSGVFMNLSQLNNLKGNERLCHGNQTTAEELGLHECIAKRRNRNRHILLKVLLPMAIVACLMIVLCFACKVISWKNQNTKGGKGRLSSNIKGLPPKISYSDIRQATENFSPENLIGKGGFGSVYKGIFRNVEDGETILAVKVLDLLQSKAARSFAAECEALKSVRHRNLVKVITSCSSIELNGEEFKALVMEFMSHGNLDKWLYQEDEESGLYLTLLQRLNIAIDVASAIDYLHNDCDPPLVHCDLKPGNVLLDNDMVAHVGDFGLARFLPVNPSGNDSSTIGLKGSIGYIAPEYGLGGKTSTCGDAYSFGILLLEMFIAKKPTDEMFKEGLSLNSFATAVNENHVMEIADPRLFKNNSLRRRDANSSTDVSSENSITSSTSASTISIYSLEKSQELVAAAIRVGLLCAASSVQDRLSMREALAMLQKIKRSAMPQA